MFQPLRPNNTRRRVAVGTSIPSPVEGWDTSSPIADMDPKRARVLDNWFPQADYIELRRGYVEHRPTGGTDPGALMAYHAPGSSSLFAACGDSIFDVTATGGSAPSAAVTGLTSAAWQHVNFTTSGGSFLWICNGADTPRYFDGATWTTATITGVTPADIIAVEAHKGRLWFVLEDSTKAAYLPVDSIQGAATTFELGAFFTLGGKLQAIGTWSRDGGTGPDDYIVFISSRGQAIVYAGADPGNADDWSMVGSYMIGSPLGRRCITKVGGDLAVITVDGVISLNRALILDRSAMQQAAITGRIQSAMNLAAQNYGPNFGWQLVSYPRGTRAILNVPIVADTTFHQYVMNTTTGAWCRFTGQDAVAWAVMDDDLFFLGADGTVYEADVSSFDANGTFQADVQTAFSYLNRRGVKKRATMIQPLIVSDAAVSPAIGLDVDFQSTANLNPLAISLTGGSVWDGSLWDDALFASEAITADWLSVSGLGQAMAVRMKVAVAESESTSPITFQVNGFNLIYEPGEFI